MFDPLTLLRVVDGTVTIAGHFLPNIMNRFVYEVIYRICAVLLTLVNHVAYTFYGHVFVHVANTGRVMHTCYIYTCLCGQYV